MAIEVSASTRQIQGTGRSRRMRREGKVPGIVYGGGGEPKTIELDHNALVYQMKARAFQSSILNMTLDGEKLQVLLRDVQMHPFRPSVLHVDFQRVAKDVKIHVEVPLKFVNQEIAPGVKIGGGVVNHVLTSLNVSCLPADLPELIEVDLAHLELGHSIHVTDLKLPQGVEAVALKSGEDPVVATVQVPRVQVEEEVVAAVPAAEVPVEGAPAAPEESEAQPAGKTEAKVAGKADAKPAGKVEAKPAGKAEAKPAGKKE
jgi:large subunit ribosomal protein L25